MKIFLRIFCFLTPLYVQSQVMLEPQIPISLNTDGDALINVLDIDDDNDGVLDNLDTYPLNPLLTGPVILSTIVNTIADAGLRRTNPTSNYGADPTVQTKNLDRSLILKFIQPANLDLTVVTFTFYGSTENDPVQVFYLPSSTWSESTITYNSNLSNFNERQLLGTTQAPIAGKYTFNLPLNIFNTNGGSFTLLVYDPNEPSDVVEALFTRETIGKTPSVEFKYNEVITPRVIANQSTGTNTYVNGANIQVGFKLSQVPTSNVYIPFEESDTTKAKIVGTKVLTFTTTNWDVFQNVTIDPISIGQFDLTIRPLHSNDGFFNGHNPKDLLNFNVQATDLPNLSSLSLLTGQTLNQVLSPISSNGSTKFDFRIMTGPLGLNVVENTGRLSFRPLTNQVGVWPILIEITDEFGNISLFNTTINVTLGTIPDPLGIYVNPSLLNDVGANGSVTNPYKSIATAVQIASGSLTPNVYIRGGEHQLTATVNINTAALSPVVIQPLPGEHVKFNCGLRNCFEFLASSSNIEIQGMELDGGTDSVDFWCVVAQAFWGDLSVPRGGGIAIGLDGTDIVIRDNYIHHFYQKAVEIRGARYIKVYDNIIQNIANSSLSGGHGIMRQQTGAEFFTNDEFTKYRWDINSNLIFNIEQRIYSWVPSKGYIEMVLDEGKPILIDDPKDTDGIQEHMSARITNNVVAFGALDHIRLKSTPNLTVTNNTVYSAAPSADGITDKVGDTNTPKFINFNFKNNVIHTVPGTTSIDIVDALAQANAAAMPPPVPQTNPPTLPPMISSNFFAGGGSAPGSLSGLTSLPTNQLYINPNNGNFRLNPSLGMSSTLGARPTTLDSMDIRKNRYGVNVIWDQFPNDPLKLTQTILDNIPGINDGITGNENVFTNFGILRAAYSEIFYNVYSGVWKTQTMSKDTQLFHLNEAYTEWYTEANIHKNASGADYERIRWGNSFLKQDQLFDNDWLTVSQITSDTTNTVIYTDHNAFTLDGDILIDFENYIPVLGKTFDLLKAAQITAVNTTLFDRILFEGYTPPNYSLTIVDVPGGKAVRLTILGSCNLVVTNINNTGANSLRAAITCAMDGDIILLSSILESDTIKLTTPLIIEKNISIVSEKKEIYLQNCSSMPLEIAMSKSVELTNFQILSNEFLNKGNLTCTDMIFKTKTGLNDISFVNTSSSTMQVNNEVKIE
jgi:hypothetical protein